MHNVNSEIAAALIGQNVLEQRKIDEMMIRLDGTPNKRRLGANLTERVSQRSLPMLLGMVSPTKKSTTVVTTVVRATEPSPKILVNTSVASDAKPILTTLLPKSSVDKALSKFSRMYHAFFALLESFSALVFIRIRFAEEKAVSAHEK